MNPGADITLHEWTHSGDRRKAVKTTFGQATLDEVYVYEQRTDPFKATYWVCLGNLKDPNLQVMVLTAVLRKLDDVTRTHLPIISSSDRPPLPDNLLDASIDLGDGA